MASTIMFGAAIEDRADDGTPPIMTASRSVRATLALGIAALDRQAI